jgi:ribosomal protein L11 methyltransferase
MSEATDTALSPAYLQIRLSLSAERASLFDSIDAALDGFALATTRLEPGQDGPLAQYTAIFNEDADRADITARIALVDPTLTFAFEELAPANWLEIAYQAHPPLRLNRFVIYGSHDRPDLGPGDIGLEIEAATAFGTGQHGTTAGCMLVLDELAEQDYRPTSVIDVGTGSGILALAAYKLWRCPVLATDIDAEAVRVARVHAQVNMVPQGPAKLDLLVADGCADQTIQDRKPYDLVIANILAGPLKDMAPELIDLASPAQGKILLSGLLTTQFEEVLAAYQSRGCILLSHTQRDEWAIVLLARTA